MTKNRLARLLFGSAFVATWLTPAIALAEEAPAGGAEDYRVTIARALSAGFAMAFSALAAGYAQAKIGSAGAGTLAERPEVSIWIITLQALPEIIVLLGFVASIMLMG